MLELVDRHGSEPCVGDDVGVRVSPRADDQVIFVGELTRKLITLICRTCNSRVMKNLLCIFLLSSLVIALAASCERVDRSIGGVSKSVSPMPLSKAAAAGPNVSLVSGVSHVSEVLPSGEEDAVIDSAALYMSSCAGCHQVTGAGIPNVFPPLDKSHYVTSDNVERLAAIMVYGLSGPIEVNGAKYTSAMAGLGATLNDEQLAAVATHIRSSWSNAAGPVEAKTFVAVREKWGSRGPFTIDELGTEP